MKADGTTKGYSVPEIKEVSHGIYKLSYGVLEAADFPIDVIKELWWCIAQFTNVLWVVALTVSATQIKCKRF